MPDAPRCLHAWLQETARRLPDRIAVEDLDGQLSVHDLYERARRVAGAMMRLGVSQGARVALMSEKSVDAVVAIFGTLMAGAAYVPLPMSWPKDRIRSTLDRCEAIVAIVAGEDAAGRPKLFSRATGETLGWDEAVSGSPIDDQPLRGDARAPALLLFTSGSTGAPKGVAISHRAVEAFVRWSGDAFSISPTDRLLCPSPLSFDLSTLDIFSIAISGAACVVMPESTVWMPKLVTRYARDAHATIWYSVPSILMQLLDEGSFERQPVESLRTILFAGEVMSPLCARRMRAAYPNAELWNLYGPTETNVVTAHRLGDQVDPNAPIPIGHACPYATLRLDPGSVETTDGGRVGELLVAGASVMNGYWGSPSETAQSLTQVEGEGDELFYRTGDRVSESADGTLSFVGRIDRQVKRRGVRIELGEIEAALSGAPGVAEAAAVAVVEDEATTISAFVAARGGAHLDPQALRIHCARLLPSYMMPDEIRHLSRLPRGFRGKLDYVTLKALCRRNTERGD